LILAYWKHAVDYYGFNKVDRGDEACLRAALRTVRHLYGCSAAKDFGPLALKACRAQMIQIGWSRTYINSQIDRVRRMFRWAAEAVAVKMPPFDLLATAHYSFHPFRKNSVPEAQSVSRVRASRFKLSQPLISAAEGGAARCKSGGNSDTTDTAGAGVAP
jgi:hypothetical protein